MSISSASPNIIVPTCEIIIFHFYLHIFPAKELINPRRFRLVHAGFIYFIPLQ